MKKLTAFVMTAMLVLQTVVVASVSVGAEELTIPDKVPFKTIEAVNNPSNLFVDGSFDDEECLDWCVGRPPQNVE